MNVVNAGGGGGGETIVLSKRRVPCGIETQYPGLRGGPLEIKGGG